MKKRWLFFPNISKEYFRLLFQQTISTAALLIKTPKLPSVLRANSFLLKGCHSCLCDHKYSFCDTNAASCMLTPVKKIGMKMQHTEQISKNVYVVA